MVVPKKEPVIFRERRGVGQRCTVMPDCLLTVNSVILTYVQTNWEKTKPTTK